MEDSMIRGTFYASLLLLVVIWNNGYGVSYTFTFIDKPDMQITYCGNINNNNQIVGMCRVNATVTPTHGFIYTDGEWELIDYPNLPPNSNGTSVAEINDAAHIVGYFHPGGSFHYDGVNYTRLHPEFPHCGVSGLNEKGFMVGVYNDGSGAAGYIDTGSAFFRIVFPGAAETWARAINDHNAVVGTYNEAINSAVNHGYLYTFENGFDGPIDIDGSISTEFEDINDAGVIIGNYRDAAGWHGFILRDGDIETVDYPGAAHTWISGINDREFIVGRVDINDGRIHGILGIPDRTPIELLEIVKQHIFNLNPEDFKNNAENRKKAFQNKINAEIQLVEAAENEEDDQIRNELLTEAIDNLQNDILAKMDGVLNNDWIVGATAQASLTEDIQEVLDLLNGMLLE
jgi:hypothetical protein